MPHIFYYFLIAHELSVKIDLENMLYYFQEFPPRLLCAFEAAARYNPTSKVLVLISHNSNLTYIPQYVRDGFPNLSFKYVRYGEMMEGTPVKELWDSGTVDGSTYFLNNISDMLRYVQLTSQFVNQEKGQNSTVYVLISALVYRSKWLSG